jgi:hypothetical protein
MSGDSCGLSLPLKDLPKDITHEWNEENPADTQPGTLSLPEILEGGLNEPKNRQGASVGGDVGATLLFCGRP